MVADPPSVERLLAAVLAMREVEREKEIISLQAFGTFLDIAAHPGATFARLMQDQGLHNSSISRAVTTLGAKYPSGRPGLDLVETIPDPGEPRRNLCFLTHKGRLHAQSILSALAGHPVDFAVPTAREWERGVRR